MSTRSQLLWHPLDGHVSVTVNDSKTGEAFELGVGPGQCALDVYHHLYAYAAPDGADAALRRRPRPAGPAESVPYGRFVGND